MWLETNPVTQLKMQGANSKNETTSEVKSHIMSTVKVQSVAPVNLRIVRCHQINEVSHMIVVIEGSHRFGESPFPEVEGLPPREAIH